MKKNKKEIVFSVCFILFLFAILLNFGIHIYRTVKFNEKVRVLTATRTVDDCSFFLHPRGGTTDTWLKRDVDVNDTICTLQGTTFDGDFTNESFYDVSEWKLKIDIDAPCYLNNSWCGTVEVHQKDKYQLLDLRNFSKDNVTLDYVYVGQDFMIPLEKGDYIVYYPSEKDKESFIDALADQPAKVTIGLIFYTDWTQAFNFKNYTVNFKFHKGYFQGSEPRIFIILSGIWLLILLIEIISRIAFTQARKESEKSKKTVMQLASLIGDNSSETGTHIQNVTNTTEIIVDEFCRQKKHVLSERKAEYIKNDAVMHDIGKLKVEQRILWKTERFTPEEYEAMKKHAEFGGDIVKRIFTNLGESSLNIETAYNIARHHHERWDGSGYPDKLAGENIPIEARIVAVADVYDALVSKRCYKESFSFEKAAEIMNNGMGTQFDPQMKSVFDACKPKLEEYYKNTRNGDN